MLTNIKIMHEHAAWKKILKQVEGTMAVFLLVRFNLDLEQIKNIRSSTKSGAEKYF